MHLHILGIGGTFMSALALFAKALGHTVTGSDNGVYPPISDLLAQQGIVYQDYQDFSSMLAADLVLVGNAMKRGLPIIEALLNHGKNYQSGPAWLASEVLPNYRVLAVAGTHGKTSTSTMTAYILSEAGQAPGYLIGGVPMALAQSAHLGQGSWFVIEADEYDSAFFDKRPKFMHYRPQGLIMHNLEYDHADIYDSIEAIIRQFHYLLRTIPQHGFIIRPQVELNLDSAMAQGVYTPVKTWGKAGALLELADSGFAFRVQGQQYEVNWSLLGRHNVENAVAAMMACHELGVDYSESARILSNYQPVRRRLELCYAGPDFSVYDDFAHHPTAIRKASQALADSGQHGRVLGILDFASNSMRAGEHLAHMPAALSSLDKLYALKQDAFDLAEIGKDWPCELRLATNIDALVAMIQQDLKPKDAILIMSNKGFANLKHKLLSALMVAQT